MSDFDFTSFLKLMVHKKASDLFITAGVAPSMKVQGRIVPITQSPLSVQQARDMVLNVMTPGQREEFEKTHECQFAISAWAASACRASTSATAWAWYCAGSSRRSPPPKS